MKLLAHRGAWGPGIAKNSEQALVTALRNGWGVETDVRDRTGALVISHDPPSGGEMLFDRFLSLAAEAPDAPLALNVKADGLSDAIGEALARCAVQRDGFVFDMSVPDMRHHLRRGTPVFARLSEVETTTPWIDRCAGVWLDAFDHDWYEEGDIRALLARGLRVAVVSPELHGRPHAPVWTRLRALAGTPALLLCTDHPQEAHAFFGSASIQSARSAHAH